MKYKKLYSIQYDGIDFEKVSESFVAEWTDKLKTGYWYYPEEMNNNKTPIKTIGNGNIDKFNWLILWEKSHKDSVFEKSPLESLCCRELKYLKTEYSNDKVVYFTMEEMYDDFYNCCRKSFINANMPVIFDDNEDTLDYHYGYLKKVFERNEKFKDEAKNRFSEIIKTWFLYADLCLLIHYKTCDENELTKNLTGEFDNFIVDGNWKILNKTNKLQNPKNRFEYISNLDDGDDILSNLYISDKFTLRDKIIEQAKANYRAGFIFTNMDFKIKGTMFESNEIVKYGELYDKFYKCLGENFSNDILDMYNKSEILKLFESKENCIDE